ncbi:MAG: EamA family transporter [Solirubrobacterales bacterium]|nr:EamA family transporter [Solirubrobacterales bacterium]
MTAILGGIVASVCFAVSSLCASAATRAVGPAVTVAGVMSFGLLLVVPPTIVLGDVNQLSAATIGLMVVIGATNVIGLRIEYVALRRGNVGVVVPIVSTDGAIAAVIAVLAGLRLRADTAVLLAVVSAGVMLAAASPDPPDAVDASPGLRSGLLALIPALLFGVNLFVTERVGAEVALVWVLLPARLLGTAAVAIPLAVRGVPRPRGGVLALLALAGAAEVLGIVSYTVGARHELAVAAVLASQFAALTTLGAYFVFGERLNGSQVAGLVIVALGVGLLAAGAG